MQSGPQLVTLLIAGHDLVDTSRGLRHSTPHFGASSAVSTLKEVALALIARTLLLVD